VTSDQVRQESAEVYYARSAFVTLADETIAFLKSRAAENPRRRSRLCLHRDPSDALHEMLIVHHRDVYVRPHRHLDKAESFVLVEGAATVLLMDEAGSVKDAIPLGSPGSGRPFCYRIPAGTIHSLIIESEWLVFLEATTGPFDRAKTEFMQWSPDGSEPVAAKEYLADSLLAACAR
jgi:cupin fold WbuC family metalloprotein